MKFDFYSEPTFHIYETRDSLLNERINKMLTAKYKQPVKIILQTTKHNDKLTFTADEDTLDLLSQEYHYQDDCAYAVVDCFIMELYSLDDTEYDGLMVYYDIDDALIHIYKRV